MFIMQTRPWSVVSNMRDIAMCEIFLKVAASSYPDLLPRVRRDVAKALTLWLVQDTFRADVQWCEEDECFIGSANDGDLLVSFHGTTPTLLKSAFEKAVRDIANGSAPAEDSV